MTAHDLREHPGRGWEIPEELCVRFEPDDQPRKPRVAPPRVPRRYAAARWLARHRIVCAGCLLGIHAAHTALGLHGLEGVEHALIAATATED